MARKSASGMLELGGGGASRVGAELLETYLQGDAPRAVEIYLGPAERAGAKWIVSIRTNGDVRHGLLTSSSFSIA